MSHQNPNLIIMTNLSDRQHMSMAVCVEVPEVLQHELLSVTIRQQNCGPEDLWYFPQHVVSELLDRLWLTSVK